MANVAKGTLIEPPTQLMRSAQKKDLTGPRLLSRWEKRGRGVTEDETVKPLNGVQEARYAPLSYPTAGGEVSGAMVALNAHEAGNGR